MKLIELLNTIVLGLIMLDVGTSITKQDLLLLFSKPKRLVVGLILQMVFLPLLALAIVSVFDLAPIYKVGLIILALAPGGTTANFINLIFKADTTLSVSLTIINSVLILFTIPVFANWAIMFYMKEGQEIHIAIGKTIVEVFSIILFPSAIGYFLRSSWPKFALRLQDYLKWINLVILFLVYGVKLFFKTDLGGSGITWAEYFSIFPVVFILHIISLLASRWIALRMNISNRSASTISIEVGLQNTTFAILMCSTLLGSQDMSKPALIAGTFTFFTSFAFAYWFNKP